MRSNSVKLKLIGNEISCPYNTTSFLVFILGFCRIGMMEIVMHPSTNRGMMNACLSCNLSCRYSILIHYQANVFYLFRVSRGFATYQELFITPKTEVSLNTSVMSVLNDVRTSTVTTIVERIIQDCFVHIIPMRHNRRKFVLFFLKLLDGDFNS